MGGVTGREEGQQGKQITAFRILKCIRIRSFMVHLRCYVWAAHNYNLFLLNYCGFSPHKCVYAGLL